MLSFTKRDKHNITETTVVINSTEREAVIDYTRVINGKLYTISVTRTTMRQLATATNTVANFSNANFSNGNFILMADLNELD